jgi:hypothetical protein
VKDISFSNPEICSKCHSCFVLFGQITEKTRDFNIVSKEKEREGEKGKLQEYEQVVTITWSRFVGISLMSHWLSSLTNLLKSNWFQNSGRGQKIPQYTIKVPSLTKNHYRPVLILRVWSKILEEVVCDRVSRVCKKYGIIPP